MHVRYQASCVLDKPRGCRQQVLPVWGSERRRLAPIDLPPAARPLPIAARALLVDAVLRCGWLRGGRPSLCWSALRARRPIHLRRGAPRRRTASGRSSQNAPWVRRPPCSTHGRSVAHLAGSARMISLVSSATHHGISPSCLDQNLPTRFEDPSASGGLKPLKHSFRALAKKDC